MSDSTSYLQLIQDSPDQMAAFNIFKTYGLVSKDDLGPDDEQIMSLQGCAGSGKTTLARAMVEYCQRTDIPVRVTATTNQAVYVLRGKLDLPAEHVATIHSLLGLRLVPDNRTGGMQLKNDRSQEPDIPRRGLVLIDEASQLNAALWQEILDTAEIYNHCSFLPIGDPAQLSPVGEKKSPSLLEPPSVTLENIHRQAQDNPIIQTATAVREGHPWTHLAQLDPDTKAGIKLLKRGKTYGQKKRSGREVIGASAVKAFKSEAYQENPLYARILCGTNKEVRTWNDRMRSAIYGKDAGEFQESMWVIAQDAWVPDDTVLLTTSELMQITECAKREVAYMDWEGTVWDIGANSYYRGPVFATVVAKESKDSFDKRLDNLLKTAQRKGKGHWRSYYDFKQRFADLLPAYASTIHKAQGTTLTQAYMMDEGIQKWHSDSAHEKPKLRYVGITRASERMMILL